MRLEIDTWIMAEDVKRQAVGTLVGIWAGEKFFGSGWINYSDKVDWTWWTDADNCFGFWSSKESVIGMYLINGVNGFCLTWFGMLWVILFHWIDDLQKLMSLKLCIFCCVFNVCLLLLLLLYMLMQIQFLKWWSFEGCALDAWWFFQEEITWCNS